jgi:dolichol-phosphate mannosyltransferase
MSSRNRCTRIDSTVRSSDTLIFAPTYNEAASIGPLLDALVALPHQPDVLIIDDGSTDGTRAVIEARAARHPRVGLIERHRKLGIGSAHRLAWLHARRAGYARLVTLDADLSHDPADIPRLLAALDAGADVALGSRFAPGGRLDYRGWRLLVSRTANGLARRLLRLPVMEFTTSLRAARLDRVPAGLVESIASDGYSFFFTCVTEFARADLALAEIPIYFRDRHAGHSKLPPFEIVRGGLNLLCLALARHSRAPIALPPETDSVCPACLRPYRVGTRAGTLRCLACDGAAVAAASWPVAIRSARIAAPANPGAPGAG